MSADEIGLAVYARGEKKLERSLQKDSREKFE